MIDVAGAVEGLAAYLRANDLRASVDPRKLNLPGTWVEFAGTTMDTLEGGATVSVNLHLCVADSGYASALEALSELAIAVEALVDLYGTITPEVVVLPDGSNVPAWQVQASITRDRS